MATIGACACFLVLGFVDNLKGATLPSMLHDVPLGYALGGSVLLATYLGMLSATLFAGALCDLIGTQRVVLIGSGTLVLGVLGYSTARSFAMLFAAMVLLGIMIGSLMTAGTHTIVEVHAAHKGRYLNLSNIFHGVGSMLAPFYAGQMLAAGFSWWLVYQLCLVLAVLIAGLFLTIPASKARAGQPSGNILDLYRGALNRRTAGYYLLSLLYVAAETGLIVWMVEFLQKGRGQPVLLSSTFLSLYFAGIIAGRLAGSLLVDRLGYLRALLGAGIGALACLALGIFGPPALAFCLPLAGLFFATMAPTLAAAVTNANPHPQKAGAGNTGSVLGLLLAAGGIGGMLGAWSAGFVSSFIGIQLGFGVQLIYAALFVGVVMVLYRTHHTSAFGMRNGVGHLF